MRKYTTTFYKKEISYQFILALFFGALGIIILYNFIIFISTREISYLYYVLSFMGIGFHHLMYKGVASLYIFSLDSIGTLIEYASFIVGVPVFFLALFTKTVLNLQQYPVPNRILNASLSLYPLLILFVFWFDLNKYRSIFPMLLLGLLFILTIYALWKKNVQARFIIVGWIVLFTSALFMFLSSKGLYDIYTTFPHYTEFSLILEAIAFSLLLANHLKQLQKNELKLKETLIINQREEKAKLSRLVAEKTFDLEKSLDEKKLLLKELNHRVKNSMQTIISFIQLEKSQVHNEKNQTLLKNMENRVFAINDLYALLHTSDNISTVNTYEYFSLIINNVQQSFNKPHISITLNTSIDMKSDDAVYCGFILNEALTNSYQHAFTDTDIGKIIVTLIFKNDTYYLTIKDNGTGFDSSMHNDTLGMLIIDTLATRQLNGTIDISHSEGVEISIQWRDNA